MSVFHILAIWMWNTLGLVTLSPDRLPISNEWVVEERDAAFKCLLDAEFSTWLFTHIVTLLF
jgi:hypothetical protein